MTAETSPQSILPKPLVIGLALLLLLTIVSIALTSDNKIQPQLTRQAMTSELRQSVWLRFSDQPDGSVLVSDPVSDVTIEQFEPNTNHFARGVLRGLNRERRKRSETMLQPFELGRNTVGQLALRDPLTDSLIVMAAFGTTNAAVFTQLYESALPRLKVAQTEPVRNSL